MSESTGHSGAASASTSSADLHAQLADAMAKIHDLEIARETEYRIGIAVGILMSRQRYSERQAYAALQQVGLSTQRLIRDVADHVIQYGDLRLA